MFGHGEPVSEPAGHRVPLMHLTTVTTLVLVAYILVLAIVRGLRMFMVVSLMDSVSSVLFTLLAVVVALAGKKSAEAIMICHALSYLATLAAFGVPCGSCYTGRLIKLNRWARRRPVSEAPCCSAAC